MAQIESAEFEIDIELSKDSQPSQAHPQIQSGNVREKPKLPYLQEIKAASPQHLDTPTEGVRGTKGLPYLKELLSSKIRRGSRSRKASAHSVQSQDFLESPINAGGLETEPECLKTGKLLKTSRLRIESGHSKLKRFRFRTEQRFFRLTEDALELYQHFNQVKLRRNYPLISIDEIVYNELEEPTVFHLLFQKYDMLLEAETAEEANSWVVALRDAWSKWNIPESPTPADPRPDSPCSQQSSFEPHRPSIRSQGLDSPHQPISGISSLDTSRGQSHLTPTTPEPRSHIVDIHDERPTLRPPAGPRVSTDSEAHNGDCQGEDDNSVVFVEETAMALDGYDVKSVEPLPQPQYTTQKSHRPSSFIRPRAHSAAPLLRRESEDYENVTLGRNKRQNAFRLARLTPRLEMTEHPLTDPNPPRPTVERSTRHQLFRATKAHTMVSDPESKQALSRLHSNFAMVKYPRTTLGIPHERIFKVDNDNLQILWRRNAAAGFRQKSSLKLHKVVEVREGQLTDSFEKFPYDEVKEQSLSLIFEQETKKYVRLTSIDLICDHPDNYDQWIEGLRSLVSGTKCSIYPHRYETTDALVLWLKQIWTCKSDNHEIKYKDAINFIRRLQPQTSLQDAKLLVKISHSHQFRHTSEKGDLRWDGFTLLYNLVCARASPSCRLRDIFLKYATTYPALGLTLDELRNFLIEECNWNPDQTTDAELQELVKHHDYHHRAYKKYAAKNRPLQYQICTRLMSYAGFLSFLRSKDNAAIELDHEAVYQDMTQPLSHYFVNSSHNTYLEADQLKGKSSLDAYIRALLQGCRCVEIDCWDDTFNVTGLESKEPIIYHGYTLTSKIPFREVVHTIRDYSFRTSLYPVIISIENHCSEDQQSKMAKIFRAIMGDILPSENLVETEGRERLPSPQELQGKIILKGSFKDRAKGANKLVKRMSHEASQFSLSSLVASAVSPSRNSSAVDISSPTRTSSVEIDQPDTPSSPEAQPSVPPTDQNDQFRPHAHSFLRGRSTRRSVRLQEVKDKVQQQEIGQDDQELVFEETSKDLKKLIVYCRSVSIKPWNWKHQRETSVSEMFSFGEPTAINLCSKSTRELLRCTERQLVRTYPKGTRFDSSNYDPIQMWNCGIQLVALNYQKPDIYMHLNQGFFRRNGGCGYVLKPEVMRKKDPGGASAGSAPYSPFMKVAHPDVPSIEFEIELLSGQNLCDLNKKCASFTVDIHTYGIEHDTTKMSPSATHTNTLWPQWEEGEHKLSRTVLMPELCLVYFRVMEGDRKLLGQNCICLVSLQPGIKFIPMRTSGGELIPEAGLFVKIKKSELDGFLFDRYTNKSPAVGKEGLETISESVEASLPASTRKLQRQKDVGEDSDSLRRTMSSPPSISTSERRTPPTNKREVEVEVTASPPPEESMPGVRSLTILPNYQTAQGPGSKTAEEITEEITATDNVVEFTLTVQGSFDEGAI